MTVKSCWLIIVSILFMISGCYEPQEGCRDIKAVNYDVTADVNCCCEYPELVLRYSYVYDTFSYSQASIFHDVEENPFAIKRFQLGLQKITLTEEMGEKEVFYDTIQTEKRVKIIPAVTSFSQTITTSEIGRINTEKPYSKLSFTTGLHDSLKNTNVMAISGNRNFSGIVENLYIGNRFYDGYVSYIPDTSKLDSVVNIYFNVEEEKMEFKRDFVTMLGSDLIIDLQVDLYEVFKDFNVNSDSSARIKQLSEDWGAAIEMDSL